MQRLKIKEAISAIKSVLPKRRPIGHHEPYAGQKERDALTSFVEKGITSYDHTQWFEEKLRIATGSEQALAVSNGTAALHLALVTSGVKPGDEVLVPTLTYAATAHAIIHTLAIPNFIDGTLSLNPYKLRCYLERETYQFEARRFNKCTDRPITALIMVHLLGVPCEIAKIREITDKYGLKLIEDAAEALGSYSGNQACGTMGDVAALSFNHNKIVTTGGGGALLSDDPMVIAKAYQLAHQGRTSHPWLVEHDAIGWNYAMPTVSAALGVAQLEQLPFFLKKKRQLHKNYFNALLPVGGMKLFPHPEGSNCWLNMILTDYPEDRDLLLQALHNEAIHARALFSPLHEQAPYVNYPRDINLEYARHTAARAVCLPSGVALA